MEIIIDYPPMFEEIDRTFRIGRRAVIFSWGDIIYNPQGVHIPEHLIVHEAVHGQRQGDDVEGWWQRYLEDKSFRLQEELAAHQAEYGYLIGEGSNRQQRRAALKQVAKRLSSRIYGPMCTTAEARKWITSTT